MKRVGIFLEVLPATRREIKRLSKAQGTSQAKIVDQAIAYHQPTMSASLNGVQMKRGRDGVFRL